MEVSELMGGVGAPPALAGIPSIGAGTPPERQAIVDRLMRSGVPIEQVKNPEVLLAQGVISEDEYRVLTATSQQPRPQSV